MFDVKRLTGPQVVLGAMFGTVLVATLTTGVLEAVTAEPIQPVRLCTTYPNALFAAGGQDPLTGRHQIVAVDLRGLEGPQQLPPGSFTTLADGLAWQLTDPIPCQWTSPR